MPQRFIRYFVQRTNKFETLPNTTMKINHITQVGSVALATLLGIFINSCAPHGTGVVTPVNLSKSQGAAVAPKSLDGKTLILTSSSQKVTWIYFKTFGPTIITFDGNQCIVEYSKEQTATATATIRPNNGSDAGWHHLKMRFNGTNTGTYRLEQEVCTDGSSPNQLIEKGSFVLQ